MHFKFIAKKSTLSRGKSRYFPHNKSTNLFPFDIDTVIRQTYTHICMHVYIHIYIYTYIQRYTYTHAYMHEFIHTNKAPPHYPIDRRQWENDTNKQFVKKLLN